MPISSIDSVFPMLLFLKDILFLGIHNKVGWMIMNTIGATSDDDMIKNTIRFELDDWNIPSVDWKVASVYKGFDDIFFWLFQLGKWTDEKMKAYTADWE